jgi:hypothetical protein
MKKHMPESLCAHYRTAPRHSKASIAKMKNGAQKIERARHAIALADDYMGLTGNDSDRGVRLFLRRAYAALLP